jgi:hypothetical protein
VEKEFSDLESDSDDDDEPTPEANEPYACSCSECDMLVLQGTQLCWPRFGPHCFTEVLASAEIPSSFLVLANK